MEDINKKAQDDELNKAKEEIGQAPRKYVPVPNHELYKLELEREILIKRARTAVTDEEREMIHNQLLDNESSINMLKTDLSE